MAARPQSTQRTAQPCELSEDGARHCYAAVIENRAKEVGIAVLDVYRAALRISQFVEAGRCYTTTQLMLDAAQPRELVVVGGKHHEIAGAGGVNAATAGAGCQSCAPRAAFDDTAGIIAVQELTGWAPAGAVPGAGTQLKSHYLAFGAAGALLTHVRRNVGLALVPRSITLEFERVQHHMTLDRDAVASLRILPPSRTRIALQKSVLCTIRGSAAALSRSLEATGRYGDSTAACVSDGRRSLQLLQQQQQGGHCAEPDVMHGALRGSSAPGLSQSINCNGGSNGGCRASVRAAAAVAAVAAPPAARAASLFGFLNHTATSAGARLLRTNLLQPLTDIPTLELRLDSLQELLESPHLSLELQSLMDALPTNLDRLCSSLALLPGARPNSAADGSSEDAAGAPTPPAAAAVAAGARDPTARLGRLISAVVLLRDVLRCLPALSASMAWVDSHLLQAVRSNLGSQQLTLLLQDIESTLDDDAQAGRGAFVSQVQQCYAVRAAPDSLLDVARGTFSTLTQAVHDLAASYRAETALPALRVQYSAARGFTLLLPDSSSTGGGSRRGGRVPGTNATSGAHRQGLPSSFLVLERRGRGGLCVTTHELNALNSRLRDAAADCMLLTAQVLEGLVSRLLGSMRLLQRTLDNIALLDLLLSFFQAVAGSEGDFCRPRLSQVGPLAITAGRHPLLLASTGSSSSSGIVANDTYVSTGATLQLLTGPNMSGKSTQLTAVGLMVVMAQIGCYVPARAMMLRPYTSLHTRIGVADSIESNASSFMVEMADTAHIMARAGSSSLVLVDELGRATSTADGVALSWAVAEYLLALGAHVLLVTHFRQLEELAALYPSCRLWRMQVAVRGDCLEYTWRAAPANAAGDDDGGGFSTQCGDGGDGGGGNNCSTTGSVTAQHYGVTLARMAGLPPAVTARALQVSRILQAQGRVTANGNARASDASCADDLDLRHVYAIVHKLACVSRQAAATGVLGPAGAELIGVTPAATNETEEVDGVAAAAIARCAPLVAALKQEAAALLLQRARRA